MYKYLVPGSSIQVWGVSSGEGSQQLARVCFGYWYCNMRPHSMCNMKYTRVPGTSTVCIRECIIHNSYTQIILHTVYSLYSTATSFFQEPTMRWRIHEWSAKQSSKTNASWATENMHTSLRVSDFLSVRAIVPSSKGSNNIERSGTSWISINRRKRVDSEDHNLNCSCSHK